MRMAGVGVYYAYANEERAPYGLSTAAIYADQAEPFAQQSMTIRHVPVGSAPVADLCGEWAKQRGEQL